MGGHIKEDLRYTQKPTYFGIFTNNSWSYLLWSPVIAVAQGRRFFFSPYLPRTTEVVQTAAEHELRPGTPETRRLRVTELELEVFDVPRVAPVEIRSVSACLGPAPT